MYAKRARLRNHSNNILQTARIHAEIESFEEADNVSGIGYLGLGDNFHALSAALLKEKGYRAGDGLVLKKAAEWSVVAGRRVFPSWDLSKKDAPELHCRHRWTSWRGFTVC